MAQEFDGRCVRCKWKAAEEGKVFCEECSQPAHTPSLAASRPRRASKNVDAPKAMNGAVWLIGFGCIALLALAGRCSDDGSVAPGDRIAAEDRKAYEALRSGGYTDREAREASSSVRRLCEAGGGSDCS